MTVVERLPGDACRYFAKGRCLYEECLNPGLHRGFQCAVLVTLEDKYDDFLDRAEAFRLDMKTVGSLWEKRFAELARSGRGCPLSAPRDGGGFMECPSLHQGLCLSAFDLCKGRCRHFQRADDEHEGEPTP